MATQERKLELKPIESIPDIARQDENEKRLGELAQDARRKAEPKPEKQEKPEEPEMIRVDRESLPEEAPEVFKVDRESLPELEKIDRSELPVQRTGITSPVREAASGLGRGAVKVAGDTAVGTVRVLETAAAELAARNAYQKAREHARETGSDEVFQRIGLRTRPEESPEFWEDIAGPYREALRGTPYERIWTYEDLKREAGEAANPVRWFNFANLPRPKTSEQRAAEYLAEHGPLTIEGELARQEQAQQLALASKIANMPQVLRNHELDVIRERLKAYRPDDELMQLHDAWTKKGEQWFPESIDVQSFDVVDNWKEVFTSGRGMRWLAGKTGEVAPSMAITLLPGAAGARMGGFAGTSQMLVGALAGANLEAVSAYDEAIKRGMTDAQALEVYSKALGGNLVLEYGGMSFLLRKAPKQLKTSFLRKVMNRGVGSTGEALSESAEELWQAGLLGDSTAQGLRQAANAFPPTLLLAMMGITGDVRAHLAERRVAEPTAKPEAKGLVDDILSQKRRNEIPVPPDFETGELRTPVAEPDLGEIIKQLEITETEPETETPETPVEGERKPPRLGAIKKEAIRRFEQADIPIDDGARAGYANMIREREHPEDVLYMLETFQAMPLRGEAFDFTDLINRLRQSGVTPPTFKTDTVESQTKDGATVQTEIVIKEVEVEPATVEALEEQPTAAETEPLTVPSVPVISNDTQQEIDARIDQGMLPEEAHSDVIKARAKAKEQINDMLRPGDLIYVENAKGTGAKRKIFTRVFEVIVDDSRRLAVRDVSKERSPNPPTVTLSDMSLSAYEAGSAHADIAGGRIVREQAAEPKPLWEMTADEFADAVTIRRSGKFGNVSVPGYPKPFVMVGTSKKNLGNIRQTVLYDAIQNDKEVPQEILEEFRGKPWADRILKQKEKAAEVEPATVEAIEEQPAEQRSPYEVLARREANAAQSFVDSAVEQFGVTPEEARAVLDEFQARDLVKLDMVTGQFQLKRGELWEKKTFEGVLKERAAKEAPYFMRPKKRQKAPGVYMGDFEFPNENVPVQTLRKVGKGKWQVVEPDGSGGSKTESPLLNKSDFEKKRTVRLSARNTVTYYGFTESGAKKFQLYREGALPTEGGVTEEAAIGPAPTEEAPAETAPAESAVTEEAATHTLSDADLKARVKLLEEHGARVGGGGDIWVTDSVDWDAVENEMPDASIIVKDTDGNRAVFSVKDFNRLRKIPAFDERIREARFKPQRAETKMHKGFMGGIFQQGLLEGEEAPVMEVEPIAGVTLEANATVRKDRMNAFQEAIADPEVRELLQAFGITKVSIEPPYKFDLSTQGDVSPSTNEIRLNADAESPINTIKHELGHRIREGMSQEDVDAVLALNDPRLAGYQRLGKTDEVIAQAYAEGIIDRNGKIVEAKEGKHAILDRRYLWEQRRIDARIDRLRRHDKVDEFDVSDFRELIELQDELDVDDPLGDWLPEAYEHFETFGGGGALLYPPTRTVVDVDVNEEYVPPQPVVREMLERWTAPEDAENVRYPLQSTKGVPLRFASDLDKAIFLREFKLVAEELGIGPTVQEYLLFDDVISAVHQAEDQYTEGDPFVEVPVTAAQSPHLELDGHTLPAPSKADADLASLPDEDIDAMVEQSELGEEPEPPETVTILDDESFPITEFPVAEIELSQDVEQFKGDADPKTGVVAGEELQGQRYSRIPKNPIVLWRRKNGRIEVVTGRHRLDLAKRLGEQTVPAQVVTENEVYNKQWAMTLDAESNIRDGQGKVRDYALYFRHSPQLTEAYARAEGLLDRAKGKAGWALGKYASDDLYTAYRNDAISERDAVAIAEAAPGNAAAQREGISQSSKGVHGDALRQTVKIVATVQQVAPSAKAGVQSELFGHDDAAIRKAREMGQFVAKQIADIRTRINTVWGAAKNPKIAAQEGLDLKKDPSAIFERIKQLQREIIRWENWEAFPDLRAQVVGEEAAAALWPEGEPKPAPVAQAAPRTWNWIELYEQGSTEDKAKILFRAASQVNSEEQAREVWKRITRGMPEESSILWTLSQNPASPQDVKDAALERYEQVISEKDRAEAQEKEAVPSRNQEDVFASEPRHTPQQDDANQVDMFRDTVRDARKNLDDLERGAALNPAIAAADLYRQAKPHLMKAWRAFKNMGYRTYDFVRFVTESMGEHAREMLRRFKADVAARVTQRDFRGDQAGMVLSSVEALRDLWRSRKVRGKAVRKQHYQRILEELEDGRRLYDEIPKDDIYQIAKLFSPEFALRDYPYWQRFASRIIEAELFHNRRQDEFRAFLHDAKRNLTEDQQKRVRKAIEVLDKGDPSEVREWAQREPEVLASAKKVREYFNSMRSRIKEYKRLMFRLHVPPSLYEAFDDIINGADPNEVIAQKRAEAKAEGARMFNVKELLDLIQEYDGINRWGLDDYVTNIELGSIKLLDADGVCLAVAVTKRDAIRKARELFEANPDLEDLHIERSYDQANDLGLLVTQTQANVIRGKVAAALKLEAEEIKRAVAEQIANAALRGQIRIKPTNVFAGALQKRKYVLRGEENIFDALPAYSYSVEKKMALDPVLTSMRKVIHKAPRNVRALLERQAQDAKGIYHLGDRVLDELMTAGKEALYRKTGGATEALSWLDPHQDKGRHFSRLAGRITKAQSALKLGYRPAAALVNKLGGEGHTWVKVGLKYMKRATDFLNTEEGKAFIEREHHLGTMGMSFVLDLATGKDITAVPKWHPMWLFSLPEKRIRERCIVANYLWARDHGFSKPAALEHARRALRFQNFTYNTAALPVYLRSPGGRIIGQFKTYMAKEIEFVASLSGVEKLRYFGLMMAMSGPRGAIYFLKNLPLIGVILGAAFLDDLEKWMLSEHPNLASGVPGILGMDIVAASVPQLPSRMEDIAGVTLADAWKTYKSIVEVVAEGGSLDWSNPGAILANYSPIAYYWDALINASVSDDGYVRDRHGNKVYQLATWHDKALLAMGIQPIEMSARRKIMSLQNKEELRRRNQLHRATVTAVNKLRAGEDIPEDLLAEIDRLSGGRVNEVIESAFDRMMMEPEERQIRRTPTWKRGQVAEELAD